MAYVDINPIPRFPVFTPRQAVAYALGEVDRPDKDYEGLCLHFCAWSYGFQSSGVRSAADFWRGTPTSQKAEGGSKPPVGALAFWLGGSQGFGHVSIVAGYRDGRPLIATNDLRRAGRIDVAPLSEVASRWGQRYVGWAKPYFPFGTRDDRPAPDVYPSADAWGDVYQSRLVKGQAKSASVRRLQYRLGLKPTGNYNSATVAASAKWQGAHGWETSGERWSAAQLDRLFGGHYFVHRSR